MAEPGQCPAAHAEDHRPCEGPSDAVRIIDREGTEVSGCVRHGAVLLASLDGARVYPGSVGGAAIEVYTRAQRRRPFDFDTDDEVLRQIHEPTGPPRPDLDREARRVAALWLHDALDTLPHPDLDVLRDYTPDAAVAARVQACVPDVVAAVRQHLRDMCPPTPDSEEADHGRD